ncbi:MAG: hypothetical protein PWR10_1907 [Halanaerobiales bacterium]|nr:hypothetical protein [Halanaerobiales bacterium]
MKWEGLRKKHPDSWVLFEAVQAHSNEGKRIVEDLSVLDIFNDSEEAIKAYRKLHKKEPQRELYVAHTKKENLEIQERKWLGVRV